jgi:hypothetical protein
MEHLKQRVEELAGAGAPEEDIAAELRIPLADLREHYGEALTYGNAKGKNDILTTFYKQVQAGTNFSSVSMWVKARCGWRENGTANGSTVSGPLVNLIVVDETE